MDTTKINRLMLLSLFINATLMGILAFIHYNENKVGYTITFTILCLLFLFLMVFTIYGFVRNKKRDIENEPRKVL